MHKALTTAVLNEGGLIIPAYGWPLMLLKSERKDIMEMLFYPGNQEGHTDRTGRIDRQKVVLHYVSSRMIANWSFVAQHKLLVLLVNTCHYNQSIHDSLNQSVNHQALTCFWWLDQRGFQHIKEQVETHTRDGLRRDSEWICQTTFKGGRLGIMYTHASEGLKPRSQINRSELKASPSGQSWFPPAPELRYVSQYQRWRSSWGFMCTDQMKAWF